MKPGSSSRLRTPAAIEVIGSSSLATGFRTAATFPGGYLL
jgi:hypothetical protein